jgi:hypothetical protein
MEGRNCPDGRGQEGESKGGQKTANFASGTLCRQIRCVNRKMDRGRDVSRCAPRQNGRTITMMTISSSKTVGTSLAIR